jgi:exonuclease III
VAGVGILIRSEQEDKIVRVTRCSERCMMVKMVAGKRPINVISTYAPHTGRSDEDTIRFRD